ncbi:MAG: dTDP-4-amino-4,6-dideoxygalactose transaminase [Bacteroidales bacterium]|nr:dTDP-4-amino-4,6-dideoxygalactose transaminase [Bacteroidales bacterium]
MKIPFNKPYLTGKEAHYIYQAVYSGKISGNGSFTKKCQQYFESRYGFKKTLLTTSCTDALEMTAILMNIMPGDEVIVPSYTFVSTALAFIRQGAYVRFADSEKDTPNIDAEKIEPLINDKTKAIIVVHYAGMACDMDKVMALAHKYNLFVVEDAAQAVDSFYKGKPLGSIGHLGTFSFHETKNLSSGEGGMLTINDDRFIERAEIIWEKGTNRSQFFRGQINKYCWVDTGSSFLLSDVIAAFLYAQLENIDDIQSKRKAIWNHYYNSLIQLQSEGFLTLAKLPNYATNNSHMFYLVCNSIEQRTDLISYLKSEDVLSVFHYLSLHKSEYYKNKHDGRELPMSDIYENCLLRLPLYYELSSEQVSFVCEKIISFFRK